MPPATKLPLTESWRRRLFIPAYTVADAARYANAYPQTVAYWHKGGRPGPTLPGKRPGVRLSYMQLAEVAFVATFRKLGVTLPRLRKAREYLAQTFNSEFPFAEYRLRTEGVHVLLDLEEVEGDSEIPRLIIADKDGQMAWERMVEDRFMEFDYEHDLAVRWHVAGRGSPIIIDPRVSFGAPTIHGIATWAIKGRALAGESVPDIGRDFHLSEKEVNEALTFEGIQLAA